MSAAAVLGHGVTGVRFEDVFALLLLLLLTCVSCVSLGPPVKHSGNLTLDQVIDVARTMRFKSMAKTLTGTVKEILGTCFRYRFDG